MVCRRRLPTLGPSATFLSVNGTSALRLTASPQSPHTPLCLRVSQEAPRPHSPANSPAGDCGDRGSVFPNSGCGPSLTVALWQAARSEVL
jgi:hypothetical protein